eukprot:TRINITY_DN10531_c0_g3_i1.p1 TRINITY_DN10531_c0_g3~~TRINITY_DN10531_c0_g3_i1.p1  ORF type:complete len:224 (+),score=41.85 TRINITY_DN10531_c0_g3_i1:84-755(+)
MSPTAGDGPERAAPLADSSMAKENGQAWLPLTVSMKRRLQRKRSQASRQQVNAGTSCESEGKRPRCRAEASPACRVTDARAIPCDAAAPTLVPLSARDLLDQPCTEAKQDAAAGGDAQEADADKYARRESLIKRTKSLPAYEVFCRLRRERSQARSEVPQTPDASDRSISRRRWEADVRQWRSALRKIADEAVLAASSSPYAQWWTRMLTVASDMQHESNSVA